MVQPVTPFGKILHDNPHLAKAFELLEMLPALESIGDPTAACLELGRLHSLSKMAHQELLDHCCELMRVPLVRIDPVVPLEVTLTQVEEGRWMAEVVAMPDIYAIALTQREAIEKVRAVTLKKLGEVAENLTQEIIDSIQGQK